MFSFMCSVTWIVPILPLVQLSSALVSVAVDFLYVRVADPEQNPLDSEDQWFSVRVFLPLGHKFQLFQGAGDSPFATVTQLPKHFQGHQNVEVWHVTCWQNLFETVGINSKFYWWISVTKETPLETLTSIWPLVTLLKNDKIPVTCCYKMIICLI